MTYEDGASTSEHGFYNVIKRQIHNYLLSVENYSSWVAGGIYGACRLSQVKTFINYPMLDKQPRPARSDGIHYINTWFYSRRKARDIREVPALACARADSVTPPGR